MRALLLEGGGAKGAYQAGAIKALKKKGIKFDLIGGTSIGAINAAFCVLNNYDGMYKLWLESDTNLLFGIDPVLIENITNKNFRKIDYKESMNTIKKIIKNRGIDTSIMRKILSKYINENRFRRSKIDFAMNTFNLSNFKPVEVFKKDIPAGKLIDYIISSAYLPGFKLERIIDDNYYLDGGVYSNCPIDLVVDHDYDEIYVIRCWQRRLSFKNRKNAKIHILKPREDLGSILLFEPKSAKYRMELGYYDMIKYLDKLDGTKYYFKYYSEEYYDRLFDKVHYNRIIKEYNKNEIPKSNKDFILKIIERVCKELNINRFKVYNLPYLITRLKYNLAGKTNNQYYDFIRNIRVDFEG